MMMAACAVCLLMAGAAQRLNPSARELLQLDRALLPAEVSQVLEAVRNQIAGRTCRLSYMPGGMGPEMLMGRSGWPRLMRMTSGFNSVTGGAVSAAGGSVPVPSSEIHVDVLTVVEYTGEPARRCDGQRIEGDLVIEYEHRSDRGWSATARTRTDHDVLSPVFNMLAGALPVEAGGRREIDGRLARALVARYKLPSGAMGGPPAGTMQSLWIEIERLLPLRWSLSVPAATDRPAIPDYGMSFTYDIPFAPNPLPNVNRPDCIR
jgi:hypothetical protein